VSDVERAVDVLAAGGLVAFPTETVYGLGADAENPEAVARIFAVKGRPTGHPLIVHLAGAEDLDRWCAVVPETARALAAAFWPGPLTVIVPRAARVPDAITGGRPDVGLRVPAHPVALALLAGLSAGRPGGAAIAAPSANRFGRVSPTTAAHVRDDLGTDVDLILDGGPCRVGVESTIVDCTADRPEVLRLGGIDLEHLAEVLGQAPGVGLATSRAPEAARAPGMLASHYAPRARVVVVDDDDVVGAVSRQVEAVAPSGGLVVVMAPTAQADLPTAALELEPVGPTEHYSQVLYDRLRQADRLGATVIVAIAPEPGGLGDTIRDRLRRASS
jgi:L-threonylcarbamoyladenylate synthase